MRTLLAETLPPETPLPTTVRRPRLGFLGVGWIGRHRLDAIAHSDLAHVAVVADSCSDAAAEVGRVYPGATVTESLEDLLEVGVDGVVIATPSALHAEQAIALLERGVAVFCQKPLGRNAEETRRVIDAARAANRLLGVDLSYRFVTGARRIRDLCQQGELGDVFAVDLVFHNAYGPDKAWFYDWKLAGGGCVADLGIHLVDLALWTLGFQEVCGVTSRFFSKGKPIRARGDAVEDYAVARLDLEGGATIQLSCSWTLSAGCDAVISAAFYGTKGGALFRNVDGSFYDFSAELFRGTRRETLAQPPEAWTGRAAVDWARRLANGEKFSPDITTLLPVAEALDRIYEGSPIRNYES